MKASFPCLNYTFGNVGIMARLIRLNIIYHNRFCCSYKVCNNEPELKTNIKEVYLLLMKTPMQNKLDIITSLISLPISLMFVFPTLCLNLFLTCRPPILLLPSGLWRRRRRRRPLACRFIRYRWYISLVRYLQFALPEEKRSLHEDEEEDGDKADSSPWVPFPKTWASCSQLCCRY